MVALLVVRLAPTGALATRQRPILYFGAVYFLVPSAFGKWRRGAALMWRISCLGQALSKPGTHQYFCESGVGIWRGLIDRLPR